MRRLPNRLLNFNVQLREWVISHDCRRPHLPPLSNHNQLDATMKPIYALRNGSPLLALNMKNNDICIDMTFGSCATIFTYTRAV